VRFTSDVDDHLIGRGIAHEIVRLPSFSRTADLALDAPRVAVGDVVKSLPFTLDVERPVLALVTGDATVNADELARIQGALSVRLARAREVRDLAGHRSGAVPRCAFEADVAVVADAAVLAPEVVCCADPRRRSRGAARPATACYRGAGLTGWLAQWERGATDDERALV
jgi:prolyl-tRNA editing enzyme YbaK/EbsC (Cys-tRNA(Pro) deacylase)